MVSQTGYSGVLSTVLKNTLFVTTDTYIILHMFLRGRKKFPVWTNYARAAYYSSLTE